jgi:glycosyltransferase involved in cell wall biosynthesis
VSGPGYPVTDRPPLSVVVPTRNRPQLLSGCLDALRASLDPADELVVVDSASEGDGTRRVAADYGAVVVRCEKRGASLARNTGWKHARHPLVAFVDDDVRVGPGWADALARASSRYPEASFVTGRIGIPAGTNPEFPIALMDTTEPMRVDALTPNPIGHTANVVVRREALERIGGFDDLLGAGGRYRAAEDQDLFDRIFLAGMAGRYEPSASATHEPWRERREILLLEWSYGVGTGARLVKLLKFNRGRVRRVFRDNVWAVILDFFHSIRIGFKFQTLVTFVRLVGTVVGLMLALPRSVRDGHFQPRT